MRFKIKGLSREDTLENISFLVLFVAAVMVAVGISVGSFVPGIPVGLAILGAFLVFVGIILYIISELLRILAPKHHS